MSARETNTGDVDGAMVPEQEPWSVHPRLDAWPGGIRLQCPDSAAHRKMSMKYH